MIKTLHHLAARAAFSRSIRGGRMLPVILLLALGSRQVSAFSAADRDACYNAWWNKYSSGGIGWWTGAEIIEMVIDYGSTNHINTMCNKFTTANGTNWSSNSFNDDIAWACIAFTRAYNATGNTTYRTIAKNNFDMMYARAWSSDPGGGLWWTTGNGYKNSAVNFPAAIAAHLLSVALNDASYATKSQNIYNWGKANLFDPATGKVIDGMSPDGSRDENSYSYNQGTFAGAAYYRGDSAAGIKSGDFVKGTWGVTLAVYGVGGDGGGFNGICLRWLAVLGYDVNWRRAVANQAWGRRNASGIVSNQWDRATPADFNDGWSSTNAVVALKTVAEDGAKAMFFADVDYNGPASLALGPGTYSLAQLQALGVQDNSISSLRVPAGWTVTFHENDNFTGTSWSFTANSGWVGAANDLVSSCQITAPVDGIRRIVNVQSGKAIDNGSSTLGSGCLQWAINDVNGGGQQKWMFTQNSDSSWNIVNVRTGLSLEMQSTADGSQAKVWTANGGANQRWWVDRQTDGTYRIWNQWNGKTLENASATHDGTPVIQWDWNGGNWMRWTLPLGN